MAGSEQVKALLRSHREGDEQRFRQTAEEIIEDARSVAGRRSIEAITSSCANSASLSDGRNLGRRLIEFDCSTTERSRSANQLSRRTFTHRWKEPEAGSTYLVVRSINRWTEKTYEQPYALAVSLRRDPDRTEIYTELAAKLEAVAEIEVAVEVEVQPEIELGS